MSSISITDEDKETFDELKPDDNTQAEFVSELLSVYKQHDNGGVDMEHMIEEITSHIDEQTIPKTEIAARRAIADYLER